MSGAKSIGVSRCLRTICNGARRIVRRTALICGSACRAEADWPRGAVARRMIAAVMPYATEYFITPMAAVAGAVAEEILAAMIAAAKLSRAYVNDGGDIALHLSAGEKPSLSEWWTVPIGRHCSERQPWTRQIQCGVSRPADERGRSFSFGIADAVTVLADRAAAADAAATIIANAIDLPGHPAIVRVPACELAPDSDLGERLVTRAVGDLTRAEIEQALHAGADHRKLFAADRT